MRLAYALFALFLCVIIAVVLVYIVTIRTLPTVGTPSPPLIATPNATVQSGCPKIGLSISDPKPNTSVSSSFTVSGTIDNRNLPKECRWGIFDAQAGNMQVVTAEGLLVGEGTLLAYGSWMSEGLVQLTGQINSVQKTTNQALSLIITEEDPAGLKQAKTITIILQNTDQ